MIKPTFIAALLMSCFYFNAYGQIKSISIDYTTHFYPNVISNNTNSIYTSTPSVLGSLNLEFVIDKHRFMALFGGRSSQFISQNAALRPFHSTYTIEYTMEMLSLQKIDNLFDNKRFLLDFNYGLTILKTDERSSSIPGSGAAGISYIDGGFFSDSYGNRQKGLSRFIPQLSFRLSPGIKLLWNRLHLSAFLQYDYGFNQNIYSTVVINSFRDHEAITTGAFPEITAQRVEAKANAFVYGFNCKFNFSK